MGKCLRCGRETHKVLFIKAVVKTYLCSQECLLEYFRPIGRVRVQKRLKEGDGWMD